MLEEDIKSLYDRMADMEQPPSSISIPGARRTGRVRLTRRRATAVATPVLAAAAVIAIALTTSVQGGLDGTIQGGLHEPLPTGSAQPAPQHFNPLRPYARFGWLPPHSPPGDGEVISQGEMSLGNPSGAFLALYAAGACHLAGHTLNCSPSGNRYPLGRNIAHGDGHPAYWTAPQEARSPLPGTSPGQLAWQYSVGGWAVLDYVASGHASAINDAVKIADHVRFGYKNACRGLIYAHPKPEVINGYQVVLGTEKTWPNQELCADNAAGTFVWIAIGAHSTLSPASIFAHHLRLLGSNPAKWTTKPIA
jgi:hypothetical protein